MNGALAVRVSGYILSLILTFIAYFVIVDPEYFHWSKLEVLVAYLRGIGKQPETLKWLDLGCGRGDLIRLGKSTFGEAFGCDVSPESVK